MKRFLVLVGCISWVGMSLFSCASFNTLPYGESPPTGYLASMVDLMANPHVYHGKEVTTFGYLCLDFESNALYFHREDFEYLLMKNAVRIHIGKFPDARKFNEQYILVQGTFKAKPKSAPDIYSGGLTDIERISPVPSRKELKLERMEPANP